MTKQKMLEHERLQLAQLLQVWYLVIEIFNDWPKSIFWMTTKNPMLGNASPMELYRLGRMHKVLQFVKSAKEENNLEE